jgi:hypothetical protein
MPQSLLSARWMVAAAELYSGELQLVQ